MATIQRFAHLIGGCRMGADERSGVVDANLRSFVIPNLYVVDGSVCPTQGAANPALTIIALAARAADPWPVPPPSVLLPCGPHIGEIPADLTVTGRGVGAVDARARRMEPI